VAATPEAKVKVAIRRMLTTRGAYVRPTVMAGYGASGQLDLYVCYRGRYLGIEAKALASSKVTELQRAELDAVRAAGGIALIIHRDNLTLLTETLNEIDTTLCTSTHPTSA